MATAITFPAWIVESSANWGVREVGSALDVRVAETLDFPYKVYVFQTQAEADSFAAKKGNTAAASAKPGQSTIGPGVGNNAATANAGNAAAASLSPLGPLFQPNIWLRVAEVALGLVLIAVGVARATGTQNAISSIVKARIP